MGVAPGRLRMGSVGLWAVLTVVGGVAVANAQPGPHDRCVNHEDVAAGPNLVGSRNGPLLAWNPDGRGRIRDQSGHWSAELKLASPEIKAAIADPDGFLLIRRGPAVDVLLLDSTGSKRDMWSIDLGTDEVALASAGTDRWLLTNRVLIPLFPKSLVGPRQPLPSSIVSRVNPGASFPPPPPPPALLEDGNPGPVLCLPSSPYAEGWGEGVCERTGSGGWRVNHRLEGPAVLCGEWIVQTGENVATVRSAKNGQIRATKRVDVAGQIVCIGPDRVAAGGKAVSVLTLPSLSLVHRVGLQRGRVTSMALTSGAIAVATDDRSGIDLISLECAGATGPVDPAGKRRPTR